MLSLARSLSKAPARRQYHLASSKRRYCVGNSSKNSLRPIWPPDTSDPKFPELKYLIRHTNWTRSFRSEEDGPNSHIFGDKLPVHWQNVIEKSGTSPKSVVERFEAVLSKSQPVPPRLINVIISAYGRLQLGHRVLQIIVGEVEKGLFVPQRRHLTNLIGALSRSGDLESVLALYKLMEPHGIQCVTFITLIDSLSRANYPELIYPLWKEYQTQAQEWPVMNLYTTICEASIKANLFDVFREAELQARHDYKEALASKSLSRIASSQLTPKHCIFISELLRTRWLTTLRPIIPQSILDDATQELSKWRTIRPALPGVPLNATEIQAWHDDIDKWTELEARYGMLPRHDAAQDKETLWNQDGDFYGREEDGATWKGDSYAHQSEEEHEERVLKALDARREAECRTK